jgi:small ligand-binding sensory domain FIST
MHFAAALSQHPLPTQATGEVMGAVLEQLDGERPDLVVCFVSPQHVGAFEDIAAAMRGILEPTVLLGMTAGAVIGGGQEIEDAPAVSAFAAVLPHSHLTAVALHGEQTADGPAITGWPDTPPGPDAVLLLLADPFTFPTDELLRSLPERAPGLTAIGGLASAGANPGGNRLVLDDAIVDAGAVGVLLDGGVAVHTLVAQGCRPVGQPFIVTRAEGSLVLELGGQPAVGRLQELADEASDDDRELLRQGLHVGLVVDEHRVEFGAGDFLVRNLLGADPNSGALVIGEQVRVGQTVQFHVRDAAAADDNLQELLVGRRAAAGLVFSCTGRGRHLFGIADHDAGAVHRELGPIPVAGAFCAGEIGPVGGQSFVHTFTASMALFDVCDPDRPGT